MARQNHGPLTKARGRIGGVVYQQYEGRQYAREYQPVVLNPNTQSQIENRTKFKAASQFVAMWKEFFLPILSKYSRYERFRRGYVLASAYRHAIISHNIDPQLGDIIQAVIPGAEVVADVNTQINLIVGSNLVVVFNETTQTIAVSDNTPTDVIYIVKAFDKNGVMIGSTANSITASTTPTNINLPLIPLGVTNVRYDLYAIAVGPINADDNSGANTHYDNLLAPGQYAGSYYLDNILSYPPELIGFTPAVFHTYVTQ